MKMRLYPLRQTAAIDFYTADLSTSLPLPFADGGIKAGFPSPAQDYMDLTLDLNKELIRHPSATFYGRVKGNSMEDAGISDGDILVIDRAAEYRDGMTAVCFIDGEFTVKKIRKEKDKLFLMPANPQYEPIEVTPENDFMIWGVVTYVIKKM